MGGKNKQSSGACFVGTTVLEQAAGLTGRMLSTQLSLVMAAQDHNDLQPAKTRSATAEGEDRPPSSTAEHGSRQSATLLVRSSTGAKAADCVPCNTAESADRVPFQIS